MAVQGAAVIAAKIALAVAADKEARRKIGTIIAVVCLPPALILLFILGMFSGSAGHNNSILDVVFNGKAIPSKYPAEYRVHIEEMWEHFSALEDMVDTIDDDTPWEEEPDILRIKAVFYVLFFGAEAPEDGYDEDFYLEFVECFLEYDTDEDGNPIAVPLTSMPEVYAKVGDLIGRAVTPEEMANINTIYLKVKSGDFSSNPGNVSLEGGANGTHDLIVQLTADDDSPAPTGGYSSPVDGSYRVSCEFGTGYEGHTGMDIAIPEGTPIKAVADGTVLFTRASSTGYGIHAAINHGGGVVTLYAHNSALLVGEGQKVSKGETIALSGDTGNSTGPHLHLEFVIDGVPMNPRLYLP